MSGPTAQVIADSINPNGNRLITIEARMHRFVLAEMNAHRVFSRNSASSRAIPVKKQIDAVLNDPAIPLEWGSNQPGMQAGDVLAKDKIAVAYDTWIRARDAAVNAAQSLLELGVHKQISNRLLEPFMWHTVIVSSTEWTNFFQQRLSPLAQPEIRECAKAISTALENSTPQELDYDQWHIPYVDEHDLVLDEKLKISAARCARVSYLTHDGVRDIEKDLDLYHRLVTANPIHGSPLEHVAYASLDHSYQRNFRGWVQMRTVLEETMKG